MDYRKRAVMYKDEGHTFKELKKAFNIPAKTYYIWKKNLESGYYETKRPIERSGKIDKQALIQAVEEKPDAYLRELAEPFNCTPQAVFYMLKKLKITYKKKTFTYEEKDDDKRQEFLEKLSKVSLNMLVFLDESGIKTFVQRGYGRALRGKKIADTTRGKRSKRINVVAALFNGEHVAVRLYTHTMNSKFFVDWFVDCLLKEVPKGCTIVMDNASFHSKAKLHQLAEEAGVTILFLPPYSPDLNPIETSWANLKRWLRDNSKRFWSFYFAIMDYFQLSDLMIKQLFDGFKEIVPF
jgi:transposase